MEKENKWRLDAQYDVFHSRVNWSFIYFIVKAFWQLLDSFATVAHLPLSASKAHEMCVQMAEQHRKRLCTYRDRQKQQQQPMNRAQQPSDIENYLHKVKIESTLIPETDTIIFHLQYIVRTAPSNPPSPPPPAAAATSSQLNVFTFTVIWRTAQQKRQRRRRR